MTPVDADTGEIVEPPPFTEVEASAWASSVKADWVALTDHEGAGMNTEQGAK